MPASICGDPHSQVPFKPSSDAGERETVYWSIATQQLISKCSSLTISPSFCGPEFQDRFTRVVPAQGLSGGCSQDVGLGAAISGPGWGWRV